MKTTFKTYSTHEKIETKRRQLVAKTGIRWECYHTGSGVHFCPVIDQYTIASEQCGKELYQYLTNEYQSFTGLATTSGMALERVLRGAKYLVQNHLAVPTANRATSFGAIKSV